MAQTITRDAAVDELASRAEISEQLALHSRGVDRADGRLLGSAYHADAGVDYGFFKGPADQLVAMLAAAQKTQPVTLHRTSNLWLRIQGNQARSESYVIAYAEHATDGNVIQRFICGRYLDVLERRDGAWRLAHRTYVMDANLNRSSTTNWQDPDIATAKLGPRGGHGAADAGRVLLAQHTASFTSEERSSMTTQHGVTRLEQALTRNELHDLGMAYARAIDRADPRLMASIFHPDATVVSGLLNGAAAGFAKNIVEFVRANLERSFHSVANEWYEIQGDDAVGESYVIANVTANGSDILTGGRYIDRYQRRSGIWKILHRTFVVDWTNTQPTSHETGGLYASLTTRGCYGTEDPVYAFWKGA